MLGLAAGCGVEDLPDTSRDPFTTLDQERVFEQGSLQIREQISITASTIGTIYEARATVLNLGADLPAARVELVRQRIVEEFGGGTSLGEEKVVAVKELGTLVGGASRSAALSHTDLGGSRIQLFVRVANIP